MRPWIIEPRSRSGNRTMGTTLNIVIGGDFNVWDNSIRVDGDHIVPVAVERITNYQGGTRPFTKITIDGVEFGKHTIQLDDQQPIVFYTNPLY